MKFPVEVWHPDSATKMIHAMNAEELVRLQRLGWNVKPDGKTIEGKIEVVTPPQLEQK
jgi:hypothetical protein